MVRGSSVRVYRDRRGLVFALSFRFESGLYAMPSIAAQPRHSRHARRDRSWAIWKNLALGVCRVTARKSVAHRTAAKLGGVRIDRRGAQSRVA